jgi:hypothetical protein
VTPGQSTNRGRDFRLAPLAASSRRTTSGRSSEPQRKHLPFEGCPASGRPHYGFCEVYWLFATQLMAEEARLYLKAGVDPAQPLRRYRVVRRIEETTDMVSLVLEPADGGELPTINPGQYVSVFVDLPNGDRQTRQYTVSSNAFSTRLQITVSRVKGVHGALDGQVSSFLHDQTAVGDLLEVSAPVGDFVVQSPGGPLLLASAGAGITTVLPTVEHIARTQNTRAAVAVTSGFRSRSGIPAGRMAPVRLSSRGGPASHAACTSPASRRPSLGSSASLRQCRATRHRCAAGRTLRAGRAAGRSPARPLQPSVLAEARPAYAA